MKKIVLFISIFFISINNIYAKEVVEFYDCVDGDTIKILLNGEKHTIRMLAVDTPESVHPTKKIEYYGKEASNYTCEKVKNAKKIEIEYDENSDKIDKYDRLLVWVFVDDILLQKDLIENGYAKVAYLYDDYKYTKELESTQELASVKNIGIWDEVAKETYNKENDIKEDIEASEDNSIKKEESSKYTKKEIIIIALLLLIILFVGNKTIKNKAKKKLKKYLK
ncbi:MAG: thermonuclease family protein [Bacilli bacterium]|nr:thermonuclease family protein [Bacilli bacterium]